jgi:hypothetical protein
MRLRTGNRRKIRARRRVIAFERHLRDTLVATAVEVLSGAIDGFYARVIPEVKAMGEFMADWRSVLDKPTA